MVLPLMLMWITISSAQCSYDVSPCTCSESCCNNGDFITCEEVPMATIKAIFETIPATYDFNNIKLSNIIDNDYIPKDILGQSRVKSWHVYGCNSGTYFHPSILADPDSFASSKNTLQSIYFYCSDINRLNFELLTGFDQLNSISFRSVQGIDKSLPTLPFLPKLKYLSLDGPDLLKSIEGSVLKCNGLEDFSGTVAHQL